MHRFAKVMLLRTFNPAMFPQWLYQLYFWALYVTFLSIIEPPYSQDPY